MSVDYGHGTTTGISAADRSRTIRALAARDTGPESLARPGHVFPLRARSGGVLERRGHTEAAVDLARLAGLAPVGALCELMADDGSMLSGEALVEFARRHALPFIHISELVAYRLLREGRSLGHARAAGDAFVQHHLSPEVHVESAGV